MATPAPNYRSGPERRCPEEPDVRPQVRFCESRGSASSPGYSTGAGAWVGRSFSFNLASHPVPFRLPFIDNHHRPVSVPSLKQRTHSNPAVYTLVDHLEGTRTITTLTFPKDFSPPIARTGIVSFV